MEYNGILYDKSNEKEFLNFIINNSDDVKENILNLVDFMDCDADGDILSYNGGIFYVDKINNIVKFDGNGFTLKNYITKDFTTPKNIKVFLINSIHSRVALLSTDYPVVVSYDDWEIFVYQDKFYVADKYNKFIKEVELIKVEKSTSNNNLVDFPGCDYCGQSDDFKFDLEFKLVED